MAKAPIILHPTFYKTTSDRPSFTHSQSTKGRARNSFQNCIQNRLLPVLQRVENCSLSCCLSLIMLKIHHRPLVYNQSEILKIYRYVTYVPFVFKVWKKAGCTQYVSYLFEHTLQVVYQSAYNEHHNGTGDIEKTNGTGCCRGLVCNLCITKFLGSICHICPYTPDK